MRVIFYLKGAARIDWRVPEITQDQFNFQLMVKMIRADGQFLAEGVYIQASEISAVLLDREERVMDVDERGPNVGIHHKGKVERLVS